MNSEFKHVKIERHPLRDCYAVYNITFPFIPPFFGTLNQCKQAAKIAEYNSKLMSKKQR